MTRAVFAVIALALSAMIVCTTGCGAHSLRIGSKNFTESVVIAEILRLDLAGRGVAVEHRRALGGSAILWRALLDGSIDLYPEYTGTLTQELLHDVPADTPDDQLLEQLRARLQPLGIGISAPLGFEDSYALGITEKTAETLGLETLSDLGGHPGLRYGLSSEFLDRGDGWRPLRDAYGLAPKNLRGLDHDLAYRALGAGEIDVVDLYTTDAEIPYYHLRALTDDRHHFPAYAAVVLYRLQVASQLMPMLQAMAGRIDVQKMQQMNAAVKLDHQSETTVAAAFLGRAGERGDSLLQRVGVRTLEHLRLVVISLGAAALLGLPLGIVAARSRRLGRFALAATSIVQTIPSLAMFVFLIPLLGIGTAPAIVALSLYSLLPIVRNTVTGLTCIDPALRDSAEALGLPWTVRLWRIELPLAARTIVAGLSTAAVINVGTATLGALIGAGGYGQPIITGIRLDNVGLILEGAIPAAVLALLVQAAFSALDRWLAPDTPTHAQG